MQPETISAPPVSGKHALSGSEPSQGVSYVEATNPADPGQTQHAASSGRSGGPCGKPRPEGGPAPGGAPLPTSLDTSETTSHLLPNQSRPQLAIHRRHAESRFHVWDAFNGSEEQALHRRASKLEQCCCMPAIRLKPCGEVIVCPQRCRDRCCPLCSICRARRTGERCIEACRRFNVARLLTLTVPHVDAPLSEQVAAIRAAFSRLRRSKRWKNTVRGGVYGFEVKLSASDGRWHPHLHVLFDGDYYPWRDLREDWRTALNHPDSTWTIAPDDPLSTDVRFVRDRRSVAEYVAKYIAKPAEITSWAPDAVCEFALAMAGQRLLNTFGSLHGAKLDAADPNHDPAATTHIAGITTLNSAARQGQKSARVALLLFRLAFPKFADWTRRDLDQLPDDTLADGESIPNALARVAAAAEREFWRRIECRCSGEDPERPRRPPPPRELTLPY